jgi:2,5-diamino-6-(ribosylamino)-4(3H)-pyrimidinone 5'-phosphate reductase
MHVVVNAAMSADGKLSTREREQIAISGADDFDRVDALRADSDAVMVGVGTVLADDPLLTVDSESRIQARLDRGDPAQPARIVADSSLRTPLDARVLDDTAESILLVSDAVRETRLDALEDDGVSVITAGESRVDLRTAFGELESRGLDQLMVEGGGELIFSLFEADLVDELSVFVGPVVIGGRDAPTLADGDGFASDFPQLELATVERIDDGVLLQYRVEQ